MIVAYWGTINTHWTWSLAIVAVCLIMRHLPPLTDPLPKPENGPR